MAPESLPIVTPWLNVKLAGVYLGRSARFVAREVKAGRLRAARVGGRGEYLFRSEWLDVYVENMATPIAMPMRRRA